GGWHWLQENPVSQPLYWCDAPEWEEHPVCGVSWYEAEAYANFVGKRLPTEAEWEKAACWHPEQGNNWLYPWGNAAPTTQCCNHNTMVGHTTPVNAYPGGQSPSGCWDMLGNVWEWTNSWFAGYSGFQYFPYKGYSQVYFDGQHRVLRGGSWATRPWAIRSSFRNWYHPWVRQLFVGFRCAV
ncbi:MAG: SUMF1/EgtB/PvdO family nonheme iron enzyme, partial [Kamptonema sp. SIO4C4]|nr:SUMF1/EgtB/PvdO family nonheme iron enzyme [Kamptonema sp. SIO4C4]